MTSIKENLLTVLKGFFIGIAFIIPGFSGGSVAAMLGIYDKLINSITGIFKSFKASFAFLLPIGVGMILAFVSLYFPLKLALTYIPLPTLCLFVGLMIGGMPILWQKAVGSTEEKDSSGNAKINVFCMLALIFGVCIAGGIGFLPDNILSPNLSESMVAIDYILLLVFSGLAACALVVPGVSGSMILMIFGYYSPIMYDVVGGIFDNFMHNALVLGVAVIGIFAGFIAISFLMRWLLRKYPKATYWAIIGFVVGSIFTIYYGAIAGKFTISQGVPMVIEFSVLQVLLGVTLGLAGFVASIFMFFASKKAADEQRNN